MMSFDALLNEHCSDGVEFRPLWSVTSWDKKFNAVDRKKQSRTYPYRYLLAAELKPLVVADGDVKILTTNTSDLWTTEALAGDALAGGEVVAIPWGGNANVQHCAGKFVTADNRIARVNDPSQLNARFLYFYMLANIDLLGSFYRGSGIKHPNMARVLDMRVPIPPLVVQDEIVRILDLFLALDDALRTELEARRVQYGYYSTRLLRNSLEDTRQVALGDALLLVLDHRGKTPKKLGGDWTDSGHRVVSALNMKNGIVDDNAHHYINDEIYSKWMRVSLEVGDVLLTSEAPLGAVAFVDAPVDWAIGQRVFGLRPNPELLDGRYLYHQLRAGDVRKDLLARATGSTVSGIRQAELVKVVLDLPALEEQRRIARLLDSFEALTNSSEVGIPAEVATRGEQLRYYRGRLLDFEEAVA